jgi:hypothetical protein
MAYLSLLRKDHCATNVAPLCGILALRMRSIVFSIRDFRQSGKVEQFAEKSPNMTGGFDDRDYRNPRLAATEMTDAKSGGG